MRELLIRKPHSLSPTEARARVAAAALKLEQRFGATTAWQGEVLSIQHASVNGTVTIGATEIVVAVRLGLALGFMRARAEQEITRILQRELSR